MFRLGVVADPVPGHAMFTGMLSIPYINADGQVVQIRFRCMEDHDHRAFHHGKYMTVSGDPARPFNVGAITRGVHDIHICEGELDAVILTKVGLNAVALPGVKSWKGHFRRMLLGFNHIYLWADPDEAGAEMVSTITRSLPRTKPIRLEHDVSDTYVLGGKDALLEAFEKYR